MESAAKLIVNVLRAIVSACSSPVRDQRVSRNSSNIVGGNFGASPKPP
jgi:hypothetical protein